MGIAFLPRRADAASDPVGSEHVDSRLPRGIRNNNPGNIRDFGIAWRGLVGRDDAKYAIFDTPINGIRAMVIDIRTGFVRDGEDTVREIISEWSPEADNNPTSNYIAFVANALGVSADTPLSFERDIEALVKAIIQFENGMQPYDDFTIREAIRQAG